MADTSRYKLKGMPSFKRMLLEQMPDLEIPSRKRAKGPFKSLIPKPRVMEGCEDFMVKEPETFKSAISGDTESWYGLYESEDTEAVMGWEPEWQKFDDSGYKSDEGFQEIQIKKLDPKLIALPTELVKNIFLDVNNPCFALCLALTCKRFYNIHFHINGPIIPSKINWWGTYGWVFLRGFMGPDFDFDFSTARFVKRKQLMAIDPAILEDATTENEAEEAEPAEDEEVEYEVAVRDYYNYDPTTNTFVKVKVGETIDDATTEDETEDETVEDETSEEGMMHETGDNIEIEAWISEDEGTDDDAMLDPTQETSEEEILRLGFQYGYSTEDEEIEN